jgi:hypothetical protein
MTKVIDRPETNRVVEPILTEPPHLVSLYLVGVPPKLTKNNQARDVILAMALEFKAFFALSEGEMDKIDENIKRLNNSFIKAYIPQIAESKAKVANEKILNITELRVEIGV